MEKSNQVFISAVFLSQPCARWRISTIQSPERLTIWREMNKHTEKPRPGKGNSETTIQLYENTPTRNSTTK